MNGNPSRRLVLKSTSASALAAAFAGIASAEEPAAAKPIVVRTHELMQQEPPASPTSGHLWHLHESSTSRTNLVRMCGESVRHFHPDASHSLYVISGAVKALVGDEEIDLREGDYISIPAGVPHGYRTPPDQPALLISMDSPAYDPKKTVKVKPGS